MIHAQLLPLIIALVIAVVPMSQLNAQAASSDDHIGRLIAAMLGDTPLLRDLAVLTDEIGGRATGSQANLRSVEWGPHPRAATYLIGFQQGVFVHEDAGLTHPLLLRSCLPRSFLRRSFLLRSFLPR